MDNNQQSNAEDLIKGLNLMSESFFKIKSEYESKLNPEQKAEYDKQMKEQGGEKIIEDLKNKIDFVKNFGMQK